MTATPSKWRGKTLAQRIQESNERRGVTICTACGIRHNGAAWTPEIGWHDKKEEGNASH